MTTFLLDANVLIALTVSEHEHHDRASDWLSGVDAFAVSPIVEGALVRFLVRLGESAATAVAVLTGVAAHPGCHFWADSVSYADVDLAALDGHRQVTDAYLVGLALAHGGRLATLDAALVQQHPSCLLLPPTPV
ncbi:MAG TPA: TA system VapC family ribonuclease toxin [Marmoricola sp.]|nr:TA system VapC family ribonuclease toxin [Marmoricola sp.]